MDIFRDKKGCFVKGMKMPSFIIAKMKETRKKLPSKKIKKVCEQCNKNYHIPTCRIKTARFCSASCRSFWVGKHKIKKPRESTQGYFFIKKDGHYRANKQGYVKICDLIAEEKIGRKLKNNEIVHHKDFNKKNDSSDNLDIMTKKEHDNFHANLNKKKKNNKFCLVCKKSYHRVNGEKTKYCSRECMSIDFSKRRAGLSRGLKY